MRNVLCYGQSCGVQTRGYYIRRAKSRADSQTRSDGAQTASFDQSVLAFKNTT